MGFAELSRKFIIPCRFKVGIDKLTSGSSPLRPITPESMSIQFHNLTSVDLKNLRLSLKAYATGDNVVTGILESEYILITLTQWVDLGSFPSLIKSLNVC